MPGVRDGEWEERWLVDEDRVKTGKNRCETLGEGRMDGNRKRTQSAPGARNWREHDGRGERRRLDMVIEEGF